MIRIRYSDLPAGVHASAKSERGHTVIYLVRGLSAADRRAATDRLRASARVGHGPKIPPIPLAVALIADRIRLNLKNALAAARLHPIGAAIPVLVLAAGSILYALFVTVSIHIGSEPAQAAPAPMPLSAATAPTHTGTDPAAGDAAPVPASRLTGAGSGTSSRHRGGRGQVVRAHRGPSSGPTPTPTGSTPPAGHPSPSGSPAPGPSPTRSHGVCVNLGILGVCLNG